MRNVLLFLTTIASVPAFACGDAGSPLGNSVTGIQSVLKAVQSEEDRSAEVISIVRSNDDARTYLVTIKVGDQTKSVPYQLTINRGGCVPQARPLH